MKTSKTKRVWTVAENLQSSRQVSRSINTRQLNPPQNLDPEPVNLVILTEPYFPDSLRMLLPAAYALSGPHLFPWRKNIKHFPKKSREDLLWESKIHLRNHIP